MIVNIDTRNHPCAGYVGDYVILLKLLVEAAGHQVGSAETSSCHVFIEGFGSGFGDKMKAIKGRGDVILVTSEIVTGGTFNGFPDYTHATGQNWQRRFDNFRACAKHARAVWCGVDDPEQIGAYQAIVDCPVIPLPFFYFPAYPRFAHVPNQNVDVFFWGQHVPYRDKLISGLRHDLKGSTIEYPSFMPGKERDELAARSKIALNLKQSAQWAYPSIVRYWYHLSNASFILGEECEKRCKLNDYVLAVPSEQLGETCVELLGSGRWKRLATDSYERFAAELPGGLAAEELFDRSFSGVPKL